MSNLKKLLAAATLAGITATAGATGSTTPPTGTTTPTCSTCGNPPVPPAPVPVHNTNTATANPVVTANPSATGGAGGTGGSVTMQPGAFNGGGANVTVEGTHIPRFTWGVHLGGSAIATAPGLSSGLHLCKDSASKGFAFLGLIGTSDAGTTTDADCLNRELNLEEKRIVCGAAVQSLYHPNPLVAQNAMNAMAEVCGKGFAAALASTREDFKKCNGKVNVIGECEPVEVKPVAVVAAAPAPQACPEPKEPKGEERRLCAKWKKTKNPAGTCPDVKWECVGGYKSYKVIPAPGK